MGVLSLARGIIALGLGFRTRVNINQSR
jgi:hypothetical protein